MNSSKPSRTSSGTRKFFVRRHKADIERCNFVEHEIELEESAAPVKDAYPIPRIESLSKLGDAKFLRLLI